MVDSVAPRTQAGREVLRKAETQTVGLDEEEIFLEDILAIEAEAELLAPLLNEFVKRVAAYDIGDPVENEDAAVFDWFRFIVREARRLSGVDTLPAPEHAHQVNGEWELCDQPHPLQEGQDR